MKRAGHFFRSFICWMLVLAYILPVSGSGTEMNLSVRAEGEVLAPGDTVRITVSVKDMNVSSFAGGIRFDREALECISIQGVRPEKTERLYLRDSYGDWTAASAVSTVEEANHTENVGFVWIGTEDTAYPAQELAVITMEAVAAGWTSIRLYEDSAGESGVKVDTSLVGPEGVITLEISTQKGGISGGAEAFPDETPTEEPAGKNREEGIPEGADNGAAPENSDNEHGGDSDGRSVETLPSESDYPADTAAADRDQRPGGMIDTRPAAEYERPDPAVELHEIECRRDASCPLFRFSDLNAEQWYHDGIHYALESGLMNGMGGDRFEPNTVASRAMVVTLLWRQEGTPAPGYLKSFDDVDDGKWYADAVRWAAAEGIVNGYSDRVFAPEDLITREQLVTVLYRYAKYAGGMVNFGDTAGLSAFKDSGEISSWAADAFAWAYDNGLVNGVSSDELSPGSGATRAQLAQLLLRLGGILGLRLNGIL